MKRFFIIYRGQVQGVGFRYRLCEIAMRCDCTGFCRNLENGDVECEFEGEVENTDKFFKESLQNFHFVKVDDYIIKEITPKGDKKFRAIY